MPRKKKQSTSFLSGSAGEGTRITSEGQSDSWLAHNKNISNIANTFFKSTEFRRQLSGPPPTLENVSVEQACNQILYEGFAGFLASEYKCTQGKNKDKARPIGGNPKGKPHGRGNAPQLSNTHMVFCISFNRGSCQPSTSADGSCPNRPENIHACSTCGKQGHPASECSAGRAPDKTGQQG